MIVNCLLKDCLHYKAVAPELGAEKCDCGTDEKKYHLNQIPCPLYRKNFQAINANVDKFKDRFGKFAMGTRTPRPDRD